MADEPTKAVQINLASQTSETKMAAKSDTASAHVARRRNSVFLGDRRKLSSFRIPAYDCDPDLMKWLQSRVKASMSSAAAEEKIKACFSADDSV